MSYRLRYSLKVVDEDIPRLAMADRKRIQAAIHDKLLTSPELFGAPLRQSLYGYRKLRVGDYRVIFFLEKNSILILGILHRSAAYKQISKRLP